MLDFHNYILILLNNLKFNLKKNFLGSFFGPFWLIIIPCIFFLIYYLIFVMIYDIQRPNINQGSLVILMFVGIITVICFVEMLNSSFFFLKTHYLTSINFNVPINLYFLLETLTASFKIFIALLLSFLVKFILNDFSFLTFILTFLLLIFYIIFCLGILKILSILTFLSKDISLIIRYFSIGLIVISPISYTMLMIPDKLKILIYLNPLSYFLFSFQSLVIFNEIPNKELIFGVTMLSFITYIIGSFFYNFSIKKIRIL